MNKANSRRDKERDKKKEKWQLEENKKEGWRYPSNMLTHPAFWEPKALPHYITTFASLVSDN